MKHIHLKYVSLGVIVLMGVLAVVYQHQRDRKRLGMSDAPEWKLVHAPEAKPFYHDDAQPTDDHVEAIAFHPQLPEMAVIGHSGRISFFEVPSGKVIRRIEQNMGGHIHSIAYSPDGRYLAACSSETAPLRIWETSTWKVYREILPTKQYVTGTYPVDLAAMVYRPNGRELALASGDTVYLWDIEKNRLIRELQATPITLKTRDNGDRIASLAYSSDGNYLVGGTRFLEYEKLDPSKIEEAKKHSMERDGSFGVRSNVYTKEGPYMEKPAGRIWLWDVQTGKAVHHWKAHDREIQSVSFVHQDASILSAGFDGCVNIWNARTFQRQHQLRANRNHDRFFFTSGAVSSNQRWFTNAWMLPAIIDTDTGTNAFTLDPLPEHTAAYCTAFSPDGKWLAMSRGITVVLYDVTTRKMVSKQD